MRGPTAGPLPVAAIAAAACLLAVGHLEAQPGPGAASSDTSASGGRAIRVLDVPYLPQTPELCGGSAAAMVMRYWGGGEIDPGSFAHLVRPVAGGIRTDELARAIRERGWRGARLPPELGAVRRHVRGGRPVILLLRVAPERFHYVVAVAAPGASWLVHDPARAPYRRLSSDELVERWEAAGRWALLLTPGEASEAGDGPPAAGEGQAEAGGGPPAAGREQPAAGGEQPAGGGGASGAGRCGATVRRGVAAARRGDGARADSLLGRAVRRCPSAAAPRRELAALRIREERWDRALTLAREAVTRDPGDTLAVRILASARLVTGREPAALAAWNRLGEPTLSGVRAYGLGRTRYRPLRRQMGLDAGGILRPDDLTLTRRRVGAVPAFTSVRVSLRPPDAGRAEVDVAVLERPLLPTSVPAVAAAGARALAEREVRVRAASATGSGELWTAAWRWWERRPRVELRLAVPGAFGAPGVWSAAGSWERAAFALGPAGADGVIQEERRGGGLAVSRWVAPGLRLGAGVGLDRWEGTGDRGRLSAEVGLRDDGDRLAARLAMTGWAGSGRPFGRVGLDAAARIGPAGDLQLRADATLAAVGDDAPRTLWPGAGTGAARRPLLRAHSLLEDGVIRGAAFGRELARVGLEARWSPATGLPLRLAAAAFLDAAAAADGGRARPDRELADAGVGLRLGLPAVGGEVRLDAGWGLSDGARALSVGWRPPWPGW